MAGKGGRGGCLGRLLKWALGAIIFIAILAGILWSQRDLLRQFVSNAIAVKPGKLHFDVGSLLQKRCQGSLTLEFGNRLPVGIFLQSLTYSVEVNAITIGHGTLVAGTQIIALATTSVDLSFAVDQTKLPLALAKTAPDLLLETVGATLALLKGKHRRPSGPSGIQGNLLRLTGKARFRLFSGGIELPLDQSTTFQKNW
ncbi:MAG: LEA type 2 family protein [Candidatus Ozemobacteraceae bacterium]